MKLVKLFAPLLILASLLGACGDSSMSRQDAIDALMDMEDSDSGLEADAVEGLISCLVDGIRAETGDSYEEIVEEAELPEEESIRYASFIDSLSEDCLIDTPGMLEEALNMFLPEDSHIDLSDAENIHREALAGLLNWTTSLFLEGQTDDVGYCIADYVADNSGDSHRDILIEMMNEGTKYDSLAEESGEVCFEF